MESCTEETEPTRPVREKEGLKTNEEKTKVLRYNPGRLDPLTNQEREKWVMWTVLYILVPKQGGTASDIRAGYGKQGWGLTRLTGYGKSSFLSRKTRIMIKTNVVAVLLHGCETLRMTKEGDSKLDVSLH